MATTFTIGWVDEEIGFKDERKWVVPDADGSRVRWCYDRCYTCDGDAKAIFEAMMTKMLGALIDQVHQYELSHVRDPIVPAPE